MQSAQVAPKVMFRCTGCFVYSGWSVQQQQKREGGCVHVLVQQIGSWLQTGKSDYIASSVEEAINFILLNANLLSWYFWSACLNFCLMGGEGTKRMSLWSQARQKIVLLTGRWIFTTGECWAEWALAGPFTLLCHLLKHWWQMNICCLFSSSCRLVWGNGRKIVKGRCFLKEASAFFGGRC